MAFHYIKYNGLDFIVDEDGGMPIELNQPGEVSTQESFIRSLHSRLNILILMVESLCARNWDTFFTEIIPDELSK